MKESYVYKVSFETGHYYYGWHPLRDEGTYCGSPKTNKHFWGQFEFSVETVQYFDTYEEAQILETRILKHLVDKDPMCLNANYGGRVKREILAEQGRRNGAKNLGKMPLEKRVEGSRKSGRKAKGLNTGTMRSHENTRKRYEKCSKMVLCIDTGTVYPSLNEAERRTGVSRHHIRRCCEKKSRHASGYKWIYLGNLESKIPT